MTAPIHYLPDYATAAAYLKRAEAARARRDRANAANRVTRRQRKPRRMQTDVHAARVLVRIVKALEAGQAVLVYPPDDAIGAFTKFGVITAEDTVTYTVASAYWDGAHAYITVTTHYRETGREYAGGPHRYRIDMTSPGVPAYLPAPTEPTT